MKHGSLFTGIMGADLGFEAAGFETAWASEIDPFCKRVMKYRRPEVTNLGDVREIDGRRLEPVDVVSIGFPCQDLSVAGQGAGLEGARSHLFFEARVVEQCSPALVVLENVPGLFSSNAGRDFAKVLDTLRQLGADDVAWRVFDSQHSGVPQQRRRIYVVADLGGRRSAEVLFDPEGCAGHPAPGSEARADTAGTLTSRSRDAGGRLAGRGSEDDYNLVAHAVAAVSGGPDYGANKGTLVSPPVTAKWEKQSGGPAGDETQNLVVIQDVRSGGRKEQNGTGAREGDVAYTVDTVSQQAVAYDEQQITSWANRSRGRVDGSYTLTGQGRQLVARSRAVRRLTPLECERLQGFPDGWTCLCGSPGGASLTCTCKDGPRYRAIGNAWTVTVGTWIAQRCRDVLRPPIPPGYASDHPSLPASVERAYRQMGGTHPPKQRRRSKWSSGFTR